jgi:hypothetical protein
MTKLEPIYGKLEEEIKTTDDLLDLSIEDGGVLTVLTMSRQLYEEWLFAKDNPDKDFTEELLEPGVYRDDELRDGGPEDCYTIVTQYEFITRKIVEKKLGELNEKYGTELELK